MVRFVIAQMIWIFLWTPNNMSSKRVLEKGLSMGWLDTPIPDMVPTLTSRVNGEWSTPQSKERSGGFTLGNMCLSNKHWNCFIFNKNYMYQSIYDNIFSFGSPNEIEIHYLLLHNYWFKCLVKTATNLSKY